MVWITLSIALYSILEAFCVSWKDLTQTTSLPAAVLNRSLICPLVSVSPATFQDKRNNWLIEYLVKKRVRVRLDYLGVVDETVARPGVRRQLAGAGKLQALDDGLQKEKRLHCGKQERKKKKWIDGWIIRSCRHRWDQRLGLRAWRRWWRSCSPGRNSGCPWSAFYQRCSSSPAFAHSLTHSPFYSFPLNSLSNFLLPSSIQFKPPLYPSVL